MYCSRCGAANSDQAFRCVQCGAELAPVAAGAGPISAAPPVPPAGPNAVEVLVPYRNGYALAAYYLGVFSIVCGFLLGIPALVLGVLGLRAAASRPEARGKVHAWIGIVLGSLTTLVSLAAVGFLVSAALSGRMPR